MLHSILTGICGVGFALGSCAWIASALLLPRVARRLPKLAELEPRRPAAWPRLSLVVPACNEEATLEAAVASRLAEGYPELEVVLVDDRSTDGTGAIVERLAASDERVVAVSVASLPDGWLGKLWALQKGREAATGDWLLFTDADVFFEPGTLERAVAHAEERGLDHLCVFPEITARSRWLDAALLSFGRVFGLAFRFWDVEDPDSDAYVGVGAFNLVRRTALERAERELGGFEWLRLEVGDDVGLGLMLKRTGARPAAVNGLDAVRLEWYASVRDMAVGLEKNLFAVGGRSRAGLLAAQAVGYALWSLSPWLALLPWGVPLVPWIGGAAIAATLASSLLAARMTRRSLVAALFPPAGDLLMAGIMLRAALLGARRGGIVWRGTHYSSALLRDGLRVRWPPASSG